MLSPQNTYSCVEYNCKISFACKWRKHSRGKVGRPSSNIVSKPQMALTMHPYIHHALQIQNYILSICTFPDRPQDIKLPIEKYNFHTVDDV